MLLIFGSGIGIERGWVGGGGKIIDAGSARQLVMVILFFTVIYKNTHITVIVCVIICTFGHPLYLGHVPVWFRINSFRSPRPRTSHRTSTRKFVFPL